jgi:hypothetical protein
VAIVSQFKKVTFDHEDRDMSGLGIAVTHLNAPYGKVVSEEQLALALRHGTVHIAGISETAGAIITSLFTESTPNLIMRCIKEAGATIESAHALYLETTKEWYRCSEWEEAVQHLLDNPGEPLERLRGSVKFFHRPFDPADS